MTTSSWSGARWWKFDFHTHTPASTEDYGKGPNQADLRAREPREWLLDYMHAGIDCVAVTDHNTGAWIDRLKGALEQLEDDKPDGYRPLYLFPGVEISVQGGVHVLAIFDRNTSTSDIDSLLGAVGYNGHKGCSNDVTGRAFPEVIKRISEAGGLAIPAHVDEPNGLFGSFSGTTLEQAIGCKEILAIEVLNPTSQKPQLYINKRLRWTEVIGSDAHHPSGNHGQRYPGSHFTWVKVGTPDLEGLWLALLDGPLSIRRSDQQTGDPNDHAALVLESVEISKARYMGRAQPFTLELNPWLNAVIGGRGTGKSTLVEFLRTALRREAELLDSLQGDFDKYRHVYPDRTNDGLLTDESKFTATYRKDRTRFRVQWSQRGDVAPIEVEGENGVWTADQGDIMQRFPVRIYSQKQIFELAKTPLALLRIVDEAPEVDRRTWDGRWKEGETRFLSARARAREIEVALEDEPRLRGELADAKRRLAIFEEAGHAEVLKGYQKRLRQQRGVEAWEETWTGSSDRLRRLTAELIPDPLDASLFDAGNAENQELLQSGAKVIKRLEKVCQTLNDLADQLDNATVQWRKDRDYSAWRKTVDKAQAEYEKLRDMLKAKHAGDPSAYGELVQRRQVLEERLRQLESRRKHLNSVRTEASNCLEQLKSLRRDLTESRRRFLQGVLAQNPYVRIDVIPYGARETVEPEFRQLIQREAPAFEKDIGTPGDDGLLGSLYADATDHNAIEQHLATVKQKVKNIATGNYEPDALRDQRFATHLAKLPPEALDRLDLWFPEDSVEVQYSTTADGSGFRSIQEGSPGQKTAALLAFLFSYGQEPMILDQPEDDLDNHLIYDLIVNQLRRIKQNRQVIVVTHNANIVVNGDAELVVALIARGGETRQECAGSLQNKKVRDTICQVMEGGREAFEQRYRRIALEGGRNV